MKIAELVKISMESLKMMSKSGIKTEDWQHITMYEEYLAMRKNFEKYRYIIAHLAEKYHMSESSIKRVVKRLSREVNM